MQPNALLACQTFIMQKVVVTVDLPYKGLTPSVGPHDLHRVASSRRPVKTFAKSLPNYAPG
jgi:hypothetical protein